MEAEFAHLDAAALKTLYDTELQALSDALLNGASWQETGSKRALLIRLTRILHAPAAAHPAEHLTRSQAPAAPAKKASEPTKGEQG